jgi:16S rRNA A1518/A1519 N6-dimethyltransferase RsmA/KsgA/DIM1 with predicted DNA glycosylase/AP lyase activity
MLTKTGFSQRRKKLSNCLKKMVTADIIEKAGIPATLRPAEVSLEQWVALTKTIISNS